MELPNFDPPKETETPAPRKPRQKPVKRRKIAKKRAVVKARKKRVVKIRPEAASRLELIFDAWNKVRDILKPFNAEERGAILRSFQ